MRDKKARSSTMRDQMIKDGYDPLKKQSEKAIVDIHASKYTKKYLDEVIAYNDKLLELDELYCNVTPMSKILVRPYLITPDVTPSGLIVPYKQTVPVPTNSNVGKYADIESDFPYSPKAVVVSVPDHYTGLKKGDVIFLSRKAIQLLVLGTGANAELRVEGGFVHPDAGLFDLPKDVKDRHYGYVLIDAFNIDAKIR